MDYKETLKKFWMRHVKSFVKTYVTIFLAFYLRDIVALPEGTDLVLWNLAVIIPALQWAFIAVLRNLYKMLTDE
jgi:hypothetical protein